jgi:hypothetical protein
VDVKFLKSKILDGMSVDDVSFFEGVEPEELRALIRKEKEEEDAKEGEEVPHRKTSRMKGCYDLSELKERVSIEGERLKLDLLERIADLLPYVNRSAELKDLSQAVRNLTEQQVPRNAIQINGANDQTPTIIERRVIE